MHIHIYFSDYTVDRISIRVLGTGQQAKKINSNNRVLCIFIVANLTITLNLCRRCFFYYLFLLHFISVLCRLFCRIFFFALRLNIVSNLLDGRLREFFCFEVRETKIM
jgi:hypothetical protein